MEKPKLKQTEIGKIPQEWDVVRVRDIFKVETGTTPSTKEISYWKNGTIDWITPADMNDLTNQLELPESRRKITPKAVKETNLTLMPLNSIVMSTRAPVGYVGIVKKEVTFNQGCKGLIPKIQDKVDTSFYAYYLSFKREYLNNISSGSTFKELSKDAFTNLEVPNPPLPEQHAISHVLSTVDDVIQKVDKSIEKAERLKKGLMQQLLTKGIGHKEFKKTEIGGIPKAWDVVEIGSLIKNIKNGFASGKRDDKGIVQVRMNNVTTDGRLLFDSYLKVPIPKKERLEAFLLKRNDFLFNNTNSAELVGKSTVFTDAPFDCTFSNHFTRIRFNDKVLPQFILYHTLGLWQKGYFRSVAIRHVGQAAVHPSYLLKVKIGLPPLAEIKHIVEIITKNLTMLSLQKSKKEKLEKIKKGLMNSLLTGKIRLKVNK